MRNYLLILIGVFFACCSSDNVILAEPTSDSKIVKDTKETSTTMTINITIGNVTNEIKLVDNVATKAEDMARCMEGEYAYYVKNDINRARDILKNAIEMNENKSYPLKSLYEIYRTEKRLLDFNKLGITLSNPDYDIEDFE